MKEKLKEIWKNKLLMRRVALFGCAAFIIAGGVFLIKPESVKAASTLADYILSALTTVLSWIISLLGWALSVSVDFLKTVLDYGSKEFAINQQVINGWRIVRDVMNSFYIVVLIVIAIATLIRWSKIDFRQALPRLMISAILVNFSLTITMFGVNFSNSVMHTFTNEISDAMPTLLVGLRAPAYTSFDSNAIQQLYGNTAQASDVEINERSVFLAALLSVLVLFGAIFGVLFYVLVLLVRIIVLWMLMILAPLAFFLWGTPGRANSYWDEWFGEYFKQLIAGPLIVFFLYLVISFFVYGARTSYGFAIQSNINSPLPNVISDASYLFNYIIALILMYVGLMLAQKVGGTGVGFAKKWAVDFAGKGTARFAGRAVKKRLENINAWQSRISGVNLAKFPLLTPGYWKDREDARKAINERRLEIGRGVASKRLASLQDKRGVLGAAGRVVAEQFWADENYLKNRDTNSTIARTIAGAWGIAKRRVLGVAGGTEKLENQKEQLSKEQHASKVAAGLTQGPNALYSESSTKQDLNNDLQEIEEYEELEKLTASGTINQRFFDLNTKYANRTQEMRRKKNHKAAIKDLADGMGDRTTIGNVSAWQADWDKDNGKKYKKFIRIKDELRERSDLSNKAKSAFDTAQKQKLKEAKDSLYEKDEKYDAGELADDYRGYANPQNKHKALAALTQSADQGAFDNIMVDLGYTADLEGYEEFAEKELVKNLNMTMDEAISFIKTVDGRNRSDKKAALIGHTIRSKHSGKRKFANKDQHNDMVQTFSENNLYEIFKDGGKDAVGIKRGDSYEIHEGVANALKNNPQVKTLIKKHSEKFGKDILRMIKDAADQDAEIAASVQGLNWAEYL